MVASAARDGERAATARDDSRARAPNKTVCSLHLIGIIRLSNVNLTSDTNKDTYPQTFGLGYLFQGSCNPYITGAQVVP